MGKNVVKTLGIGIVSAVTTFILHAGVKAAVRRKAEQIEIEEQDA